MEVEGEEVEGWRWRVGGWRVRGWLNCLVCYQHPPPPNGLPCKLLLTSLNSYTVFHPNNSVFYVTVTQERNNKRNKQTQ